MGASHYTAEEIARRGLEIYDRKLRSQIEARHHGEFLVVDIRTGGYEIDADDHAAFGRAEARHSDGLFYIMRIGYPAAHRLGGGLRAVSGVISGVAIVDLAGKMCHTKMAIGT